ncbi:MAG TPA: HemK2/MTQ2 family protein methyltransferase [Actinophytocola sp.]|uniref:HemK2/MTQ2 family protein methyltransferase n=1 Tax=Actinophytocola sp. TaxID=1872138 RepID=UPI002DDD1899|nr:HemK2/MTQ2 family protein methyltransferase [Actinophytocola sp.]HEV2778712.1 HemK2/MTQ2 family protein methyltransferase [Actinophytocola sp.]
MWTGYFSGVMLLRAPGVYRPQADTWLLIGALRGAAIPEGARVLDVGTGTGALSVAAVRAGAAEVTAVDVSAAAVLSARLNARLRRLPVRVHRGSAPDVVAGRRFDVILANPPYVPGRWPPRGAARAWDAGLDGRELLDPLCDAAFDLLYPGGVLLVVHSELCGVDSTLWRLRANGLKAAVVARRIEPFGPVLWSKVDYLEGHGLIEPGQRHEELVVIRGDRPDPNR